MACAVPAHNWDQMLCLINHTRLSSLPIRRPPKVALRDVESEQTHYAVMSVFGSGATVERRPPNGQCGKVDGSYYRLDETALTRSSMGRSMLFGPCRRWSDVPSWLPSEHAPTKCTRQCRCTRGRASGHLGPVQRLRTRLEQLGNLARTGSCGRPAWLAYSGPVYFWRLGDRHLPDAGWVYHRAACICPRPSRHRPRPMNREPV